MDSYDIICNLYYVEELSRLMHCFLHLTLHNDVGFLSSKRTRNNIELSYAYIPIYITKVL